jgi:hypothetical protein
MLMVLINVLLLIAGFTGAITAFGGTLGLKASSRFWRA